MAEEPLSIRINKCFFSSFFNNWSKLLLKNWYPKLQCGNLRFKPDFNSPLRQAVEKKIPQNYYFLKINSNGCT